jgi:hypothetical protein
LANALIFIGVIALVGGLLVAALWLTRARPGQAKVVLLGAAGGEAEARLWSERLRAAGIKVHVRNVGDSAWYTSPYAYEVWVRAKDEARAREALGL